MSYAQNANRLNPAAMIGALGVPTAFGAVLVAGLAVAVVIDPPAPNPTGVIVTPKPVDPPPPVEPKPQPNTSQKKSPNVIVPPSRPETAVELSDNSPITTFIDPGPVEFEPIDLGGPIGGAPVTPALPDPIAASPSNNPGRWITDSDYRSVWIRQDMSGVAGFAVTIDAKGRVSDCTITRSTGHAALDNATCKLVERRARFHAAKDSYGNAIAGTFSSSVNWKIPE